MRISHFGIVHLIKINTDMETLKEIWQFLNERKKWWLTPVIVFLLLLAVLLLLGGSATVAPFVYTLF